MRQRDSVGKKGARKKEEKGYIKVRFDRGGKNVQCRNATDSMQSRNKRVTHLNIKHIKKCI